MDEQPTGEIQLDVKEIVADLGKGDEQPTPAPAPSTEEKKEDGQPAAGEDPKKPEAKETEGDPDKKDTDKPEGEDDPDGKDAEDTKDKQPTEGQFEKAEERKARLNGEIRALVEKKHDLTAEVEQIAKQVYKPQTAEQLVAGGMDEQEAELAALKQEKELGAYIQHVSNLNQALNMDAVQVKQDFPMFDKTSPDFKPELATIAADFYDIVGGVQQSEDTGLIDTANVLPYEVYKTLASVFEMGAKSGQMDGQKATEQMMAAADTPPSAAPKTPSKDPFLVGLQQGTGN